MNVQFKVVRRSADKVYILAEIIGYDERWPVVLTASTENGARIPSDTFPYCDGRDLIALESALYNAAVANHACTLPYVHTKNSAGVRFFAIALPWMNIRKYVLDFEAIDAEGQVVAHCQNRLDVNSARWFSLLDSRINHDVGDAIELLDTRFVHDRINLSFERVIEYGENYLVTAKIQMPYHEESTIEFDFLNNSGNALNLDYHIVEDSVTHSVDFGSFEHRYLLLSFETPQANPEVCLCATDTAGSIAPGFAMLGAQSIKDLLKQFQERTTTAYRDERYDEWYKAHHKADFPTLLEQVSARFDYAPLISILCVVKNTPQHHLYDLMSSLLMQSYGRWELILINVAPTDSVLDDLVSSFEDERIYVVNVDEQASAAQKIDAGILAAEGQFIGLTRACDKFAPDALFEYVRAMNEHPTSDVLYSDSDIFDVENHHSRPKFRPAFSPELLRSINYIQDFFLVRASLLTQLDMMQEEFQGAFGYDLLLRACEQARYVSHVPRVLYHVRYAQRINQDFPSSEFEEEVGRRALMAHCERVGIRADVTSRGLGAGYRVRHLLTTTPKVSIVIVSEGNTDTVEQCLQSIYSSSRYRNFDVTVVNAHEDLRNRYDSLSVLSWTEEFNRARIANFAAAHTDGDVLLFLSDDTRVLSEDFLEVMLGYFQSNDVGVVGCKQLFVDGTIEHAGFVVGSRDTITPLFRYLPNTYVDPGERFGLAHNVSAVSGECMMVRRSTFDAVEGFTEDFTRYYADIDFCLKAQAHGLYTVYTPYASLSHFRSVARIPNYSRAVRITKKREAALLQYHWPRCFVDGDVFYNPNFDQNSPYYALHHADNA